MRYILFFLIIPFLGYSSEKVALLFLTVNELNHPSLWKGLLEKDDRFTIYIHSKHKMKDKFFKKHRIKKIVPTSWGYHVKAWQMLFKEAVKDPENTKFVLLSESCVPLQSLDYIYEELTKDNHGYMEFSRPFWSPKNAREVVELPKEHRWVGPEWVILNREQAQLVVQDTAVIPVVAKHPSDAESYFASLLSYHGVLFDGEVVRQRTTYTNWKLRDGAHPYTFREATEFDIEMLRSARASGAFFARKVAASFPEEVLSEIINVNY